MLYDYQSSRHASHAAVFLKEFNGYLHADGYDGYHRLPEKIVVVGCWAHLRRRFDEALKALPEKNREGSATLLGKQYCDRLFEIERKLCDVTYEERYSNRQKLAAPLVEEFFSWAESLGALPKSGLGKAIYYAKNQKKYLERYLLDGRLEISNNLAERSIKPFVIGRKNWLFANTSKGARASAIMYSIIETAKENGLNPYAYLMFLLKTLPKRTTENLDGFLPDGILIPCSCKRQENKAETEESSCKNDNEIKP